MSNDRKIWVKYWVKIASLREKPLSGIIYKTIIPKIYTHIFSHECLIQHLKESLEIERNVLGGRTDKWDMDV